MPEIVKTLAFEHSEVKFSSGNAGTFEGYASVFGVTDGDGDIVIPGAFAKALADKSRPVAMFFNHRKFEIPVGKWLHLEEDAKGLFARGELTPGNPQSDSLHAAIKHGTVPGMSVGFVVERSGFDELPTGGLVFREVKALREISLCTMPANPAALIDSVKSINGLETVRDVEDWLRDAAGLSKSSAQSLIARIKSAVRRESEDDGEVASLLKQISTFPSILKGT